MASKSDFVGFGGGDLVGPTAHYNVITPHDTNPFPNGRWCKGILLSADAVVACVNADGLTVNLPLQKGFNPIGTNQVKVTGTVLGGATIIGLF